MSGLIGGISVVVLVLVLIYLIALRPWVRRMDGLIQELNQFSEEAGKALGEGGEE